MILRNWNGSSTEMCEKFVNKWLIGSRFTNKDVIEFLSGKSFTSLSKPEIQKYRKWISHHLIRNGNVIKVGEQPRRPGRRAGRACGIYQRIDPKTAPVKPTKKAKETTTMPKDTVTTADIGESIIKHISELNDYIKAQDDEIVKMQVEKGELQKSYDNQQLELTKLTAHIQTLNERLKNSGRPVSMSSVLGK